jgi:hemoglobin-like flavoprotein
LRSSGSSVVSNPFLTNNTKIGDNHFKVFTRELFDEQKELVFAEIANYGYIYQNTQKLNNYLNRRNYNVVQLDFTKNNYDLINNYLKDAMGNTI